MARIVNNPLLKGLEGSIGKTIYFRRIRNKQTMCNMPDSRAGNSEKQQKQISRFKDAQRFAKQVMQSPEVKQLYAKNIDDKRPSAYHVAASDYLNAPEIHYVKLDEYKGAAGDVIRIKATDDFQVMEVRIKVMNAKGEILEQGQAERYRRKSTMWLYKTTVAHPETEGTVIVVTASDRPGNRAMQKLTLDKDRQVRVENEIRHAGEG